MLNTCWHCGGANDSDARFCRFCGAQLSGGASQPSRREFTISLPAGIFHPEMGVTAVAWWMGVWAVGNLGAAFVAFFLGGLLGAVAQQIGGELRQPLPVDLRRAEWSLALWGLLSLFLGVFQGTAATGLFRRRAWAVELTRIMVVVSAGDAVLSLLLAPGVLSGLGVLVAAVVAAAVSAYLGRPEVRGQFEE